MEVTAVTAPVMSTLVIHAAVNQAPTWTALVIVDCEDTLNALGNCYTCNKPRHVRRDCLEQTQAQMSYNRGLKRDLAVTILTRKDT